MEFRRQEAAAAFAERQKGTVPRILRTGASLLFGLGARGESAAWVSSLIWSMLVPALIGVVRRSGDTLAQRLIHSVFSRGPAKK